MPIAGVVMPESTEAAEPDLARRVGVGGRGRAADAPYLAEPWNTVTAFFIVEKSD